jgi:hypothetical protein
VPRSPSRLPILGLLSPTLLLRRNAVAKGLFGGSRVWQVVLVIMFGRRFLRKVMGREPELVATEKMVPGQFLSIRTIDPRSERRR